MADTSWEDVGQRFSELGRQLQGAWERGKTADTAQSELKDAGERMKAALDDVAATINRTAGSPEVQEATRSATGSLADALATSLRQVAEWLERPPPEDAPRDRDA